MRFLTFILLYFLCSPALALSPGENNYLIIEDEALLPNGNSIGQFSVSLVHWEPNISASTISEQVITFLNDRRTNTTCVQTKSMRFEISNSNVKIYDGQTHIGNGQLYGDAWNWNKMTFDVQAEENFVSGSDTFGDNQWESLKTVSDKNRKPLIIVKAKMRAITKETFLFLSKSNLPSCKI